ncbi:cytochrome c/c1 heme lyase-domain-containing protein [Chiua virens]|nr:cytochrome c/c1 heme lyase-domain-containing protein [Chiua virens]
MGQSLSSSSSVVSAPSGSESTSGCPVQHPPSSRPSGCPIDHSSTPLNPLNQMPSLPQAPLDESAQLPTERTHSSIPRSAETGSTETWEYPSPQQFYNALRAWGEVLKWEKRVAQPGDDEPHLARFKGRPGELSPKAQLWMFAGWLLPSRFSAEPPFDRHDWIVRRSRTGVEVRYVIDYYSAPPTPDGEPVFALDVRPALDSVQSVKERVVVGTGEIWEELSERAWRRR